MTEPTLQAAFAALYKSVAIRPARKALLDAVVGPPADPEGFRAALDALIPVIQSAYDAAEQAQQWQTASDLDGFLSRLYFWRIYARDKLIDAIDNSADVDTAKDALKNASVTLKKTKEDFPQTDSINAADTSLTILGDVVSLSK